MWCLGLLCGCLLVASVVLVALHSIFPAELAITSTSDPLRALTTELWQNVVVPFSTFLMGITYKLISWPAAAVLITLLVLRSRLLHVLIPSVLSRVRKFKIPWVDLELGEQIEALRKESDDLNEIIPAAREKTNSRIQELVGELRIQSAFENLVKDVVAKIESLNPAFDRGAVRATIYVHDVLFEGHLLQLLDYVGGDGKPLPGSSSGRRFSIRYGIIGRVWRSQIPEIEGILPEMKSRQGTCSVNDEDRAKYIARIWGMTINEAKRATRYPSYLCIPFGYAGQEQALLYMNSKREHAFVPHGDGTHKTPIIATVRELSVKTRLGSALGDLDVALKSLGSKSISWKAMNPTSYAEIAGEYYDTNLHPTFANFTAEARSSFQSGWTGTKPHFANLRFLRLAAGAHC